jgi:hypothetical protein
MNARRTPLDALLLALVATGLSGCSLFGGWRFQSPITRDAGETRFGPGELTAAAIQSEIMTFADTFNAAVTEQWNRVASEGRTMLEGIEEPTAEDRRRAASLRRAALEHKLATVSASLSIASSPNPTVALADMITLITLQRMVLEDPRTAERLGEENAATMLATYEQQEQRIWRIGDRAMNPLQRLELRDLIHAWRAENPDRTYVANIRLEDFARMRQLAILENQERGDSLLSLVALDPLAGLDPAQREVQKSRMLGERIFFYASRWPQVLKWHAESLSQEVLRTPEITSVTDSVERLTEVVEGLPEDAKDVLGELDQAHGGLRHTLGEFTEAVETTEQAGATLTETFRAADVLVSRFEGDPDDPKAPEEPDHNTFANYQAAIVETGRAAERLTVLAERIDGLLGGERPGARVAAFQTAVADVQARTEDVVDRVFWRLLVLGLVIPLVVMLAAIGYRRATRVRDMRGRVQLDRLRRVAREDGFAR